MFARELERLKVDVDRLNSQPRSVQGQSNVSFAHEPSGGAQLSMTDLNSVVLNLQQELAGMRLEVSKQGEENKELNVKLTALEADIDAENVSITGVNFRSLEATKEWTVNNSAWEYCLLFTDVVSMLQACYHSNETVSDKVDNEYKGSRIGILNPIMQAIYHSYHRRNQEGLSSS